MKILLKNMVCDRCIFVIENVLHELNLQFIAIYMGEVDFGNTIINSEQLEQIRNKIEPLGFELINDKKTKIIENIKKHIIKLIQQESTSERFKLSDYLASNLYYDYTHLSNLFSTSEGVTIEQYYINQKIEKTKELLIYDEFTLTEISYSLGYSSVAHLSRQFKKVTTITPSQFKKLREKRHRRALDKV